LDWGIATVEGKGRGMIAKVIIEPYSRILVDRWYSTCHSFVPILHSSINPLSNWGLSCSSNCVRLFNPAILREGNGLMICFPSIFPVDRLLEIHDKVGSGLKNRVRTLLDGVQLWILKASTFEKGVGYLEEFSLISEVKSKERGTARVFIITS
jgi:hypothetical protein